MPYIRFHADVQMYVAGLSTNIAVACSGGKLGKITHLIWATMSSVVDVPSMDCVLVNELGLNPDVKRLAVQQMGCLSGFR